MPRPPRFDHDAILDAALRSLERVPSLLQLTVDAVAAEMGGNAGSVYYRFPSRDHLIAQLWLRCARQGNVGMIESLDDPDAESALTRAVLHYPRWSRTAVAAAQVLAVVNREQLLTTWPQDLDGELAVVNQGLARAVRGFSQRFYGDHSRAHLQVATFALLDLPVAAIRRYLLVGKPPPDDLDPIVLASARTALHQGQ